MSSAHTLFKSFLQAGFECSTHKRRDGVRLDLLNATRHERFAREDFERLRPFGIRTVRTAARWHLIEEIPGQFDFTSLKLILDAAAVTETEVLLDLLHFGWPDDVDVLLPSFAQRFQRFAHEVACFLRQRRYSCCTGIAAINEISFLSWGGGEAACINPYQTTKADELKRSLVRAAAAASDVLLNELPNVRLIAPEPVIHIVPNADGAGAELEAESYRRGQFQAWDMLSGRMNPELGGNPAYLDIVGVNFYDRNEWVHNSDTFLPRSDARYRPFRQIIQEVWNRYKRPVFIAETGAEGDERADWFSYICNEVIGAHKLGVPIQGICLYPILNHPGWTDDRHCCNGLFDYAGEDSHRGTYQPLSQAILDQQFRLLESYKRINELHKSQLAVPFSPSLGLRFSAPAASHEPLCARSSSLVL